MSDLADRISFAHQLGHLEGRFNALERKVEAFEQRIEGKLGSIEGKLDQLSAALNFGKGSWRAVLLITTLITGLASLAGRLLDHFFVRG